MRHDLQTTERGLEDIIVRAMVGKPQNPKEPDHKGMYAPPSALYGGTGWILGSWQHYVREHALDLAQLREFLRATQPEAAATLDLDNPSLTRQKFLARLQGA